MKKLMQTEEVNAPSVPSERAADRYAPCLTRLRGQYAGLTDAERRLADYLLTQPGKAMFCSIMEIAREGGVSVSTVTRLCTKLDYTGFAELKTALAVELLSPDYHASPPIGTGDDTKTVIGKVFDLGIQSLRETLLVLDREAASRAAHAMATCRHSECFAHGPVSGPIAEIFAYRLVMVGVPCTPHRHDWQANAAALLGPGDVALGLSNSGVAVPVANALHVAREAGATTVAITYAPHSPVARAADIVLLTATREPHEWADSVASRLPMLTVLDTLYACVALHKHQSPDI